MEIEVPIRIVLVDPPAGIDFGLQRGRGAQYESLFVQRRKRGDVSFDFSMSVADNRQDGLPNFLGPLCTGPACEPVRVRRRRELRWTEGHAMGATNKSPTPGNHVGARPKGAEQAGAEAPRENSGIGQGWKPSVRHGAVAWRLGGHQNVNLEIWRFGADLEIWS